LKTNETVESRPAAGGRSLSAGNSMFPILSERIKKRWDEIANSMMASKTPSSLGNEIEMYMTHLTSHEISCTSLEFWESAKQVRFHTGGRA